MLTTKDQTILERVLSSKDDGKSYDAVLHSTSTLGACLGALPTGRWLSPGTKARCNLNLHSSHK
jgi:hypothetical protein